MGLWSNFAVSLLAIAVAALLLALVLPSFEAALAAAVSAFSNIGPLYAAGWSPAWPAYADFGDFAKGVMILTMILGRIEVLALFAAVNLAYWRS
jgi:trk system potassium uptake protein TrkH